MSECCVEVLEVSPTDVLVIEQDATPEIVEVYQGIPGPQGPPGTPGTGTGSSYTHDQAVASATWVIAHNMARYPSVTVVDSSGATVFGNVTYTDANTVTINFAAAFAGSAYLN